MFKFGGFVVTVNNNIKSLQSIWIQTGRNQVKSAINMAKTDQNALRNKNAPITGIKSLILAVLLTSVIATATLAIMDVSRPFMTGLSGAFWVCILLVWLNRQELGSWLALISALFTLSILFFQNNGIRDTAMLGLIVVLIAAGLLAGRLGSLIMGCIIILEVVAYSTLEKAGLVANPYSGSNRFADYFATTLAIALMTTLQWLVISRLKYTIQSSEVELEERKKYQTQLQEAETRYRGLVENIPLVTYKAEPGKIGRWYFISPQITELTGYAPEDWENNPELWISLIHPDDRDAILDNEAFAIRENRMPKLEYRLLTRDSKYIWISDEGYLIKDSNPPLVQGFMLNITDRKLAEEQLNRRLAELQAVHGVSKNLVQKTDLQKLIHDTGEQIRQLLRADNLLIAIHDPTTNLIHFPYDFDAGTLRRDVPIRFGEGMTTRVMEGKKPVIIATEWEKRAAELNVINTSSLPAKSSVAVPIMTTGQVLGIISVESTEREHAFGENEAQLLMTIASNLAVAVEKTRLQDSIRHELDIQEKLVRELESKNEELERFTYTASHDLKSPLITIRGFIGYLEQDAREGRLERLTSDIQRISDAAEKMQKLLSELLELSRVGRATNEKHDVAFGEMVTEALKRVEGQLQKNKVHVKVSARLPVVHVDRERVVELVQNLVDNAVKFMGSQPEPLIEIGVILEDGRPIFFVRDNGIGIRKEFHKRIFGLFDKLNTDTEGTGIGLALAKRIVEVHGGSIWVDSLEGEGATFYFTL